MVDPIGRTLFEESTFHGLTEKLVEMASVGISIPPQEHVTSPVAASKSTYDDGNGRRFDSFAR